SDKGVPSVARWVHVEGQWTPPPAPPPPPPPRKAFGRDTRVYASSERLRLTGGMVSFTARNENDFGVSVDAILRLKGQAARRAKATKPSAAKAFLRAGHSVTVRIPLGHRRISLVHKHRRLR